MREREVFEDGKKNLSLTAILLYIIARAARIYRSETKCKQRKSKRLLLLLTEEMAAAAAVAGERAVLMDDGARYSGLGRGGRRVGHVLLENFNLELGPASAACSG